MSSALLSIKIHIQNPWNHFVFYFIISLTCIFFDIHLTIKTNSLSDCHHETDYNIWDASNKKITFEFEMALVLWNVRMEFDNIWYRCEMVRLYLILAQMIWRTYHQKMFFLYQFFIVYYWQIPKNRSMSEVVKSV